MGRSKAINPCSSLARYAKTTGGESGIFEYLRNYVHRVNHFIFLFARQAFSSFKLKSYLSLFVLLQKFDANKADCKQRRQLAKTCTKRPTATIKLFNLELVKSRASITRRRTSIVFFKKTFEPIHLMNIYRYFLFIWKSASIKAALFPTTIPTSTTNLTRPGTASIFEFICF